MENSGSDTDDEDYYDDYFMGDESGSMNPVLINDLDYVTIMFGESRLSYRPLDGIDLIHVDLSIKTDLDKDAALSWGMIPDEPVVIHLQMSTSLYREGPKPTVDVYQPTSAGKSSFKAGNQLKKILEAFVSKYWNDKTATASSASDPYKDDTLSSLLEMGFGLDDAKNAISKSSNKQQAIDRLLAGEQAMITDDVSTGTSSASGGRTENRVHGIKNSRSFTAPFQSFFHSQSKKMNGMSKSHTMHDVKGAGNRSNGGLKNSASLDLIPSSTQKGLNSKTIPPLEHGFLVQCMQYLSQRLQTLNEYCVICDNAHVFQNGAMLKPAVCSRDLCVFAYNTLGVMNDTADDIATGAEVVDLLLRLFCTAAQSKRRQLVLDPFPTLVDPSCKTSLALSQNKKDYDRLDKCLEKMPSMYELNRLHATNLKSNLDSRDSLCFPLLQWIISSNRSHIVRLPPDKRLTFMKTPHQFLLLCSPPAKEAKFRAAKEEYGSSFAMHGSPIDNWHSILRTGLIVATNTKLMLNGGAYGQGIYLSPAAQMSFGYSRMGYGKQTTAVPRAIKPFPLAPPKPSSGSAPTQGQLQGLLLLKRNPTNAQDLSTPKQNSNMDLYQTVPVSSLNVTITNRRPLVSPRTVMMSEVSSSQPANKLSSSTSTKPNTCVHGQASSKNVSLSDEQKPRYENLLTPPPRFLGTSNLACIAMCEVIESKDTLTKHGGQVWVCSNPDHVCTRFLFVYEDGQVGELFQTTQEHIKSQINAALSYQVR